jgi:NADH-quinone oxidoreductase subunit L
MTRQVIMVFFGKARWHDAHEEHGAHGDLQPHESPAIMWIPLVVLAGLATIGGLLQLPFSKDLHFLETWLEPNIEFAEAHISDTWVYENKYLLLGVAIVVALVGIAAAIAVYGKHKRAPIEPEILAEGWYYDQAVSNFMGGPGRRSFEAVTLLDAKVIDGVVNGVGTGVRSGAGELRKVQTGNVRTYAAGIGVGVVLVLVWLVVLRGIL